MSSIASIDLILYGIILGALTFYAQRLSLDVPSHTLLMGIVGGTLTLLWGVLGMCGLRRRTWPILTLIVLAVFLTIQTAKAWLALNAGVQIRRRLLLIFGILLVFTVVQLLNLLKESRTETTSKVKNESGHDELSTSTDPR